MYNCFHIVILQIKRLTSVKYSYLRRTDLMPSPVWKLHIMNSECWNKQNRLYEDLKFDAFSNSKMKFAKQLKIAQSPVLV
jgi:hypothetical protein